MAPLFPQLREILQRHVFKGGNVTGLLFPAPRGGGMVWDLRKALDAVGERAGWDKGEIRTKMFRHTFCAAALQTLDSGAPISPWTVAKWMGHTTDEMKELYQHLFPQDGVEQISVLR